ncbi:sulfite exporter TauE/SafE family protein [Parendozoicomonas haliclonae]|uniref:Probable membrane transporter protein n=1 Tax=Parendozoicomonas haliclonae TaxID=1960125 RepID=A0A1X7AFI1_9GAMM|nr:sulfite exporter TauE/SafE family protein [Parendozoicomonas haliclonae]SMA37856.1 Sulfite exporter TauE/SafE [Parendozoicomonas haliclonae]
MEVIGYLLTGILAGGLAGLFGVGGGVIVVPALIFLFALLGLPDSLATHMAIGTSLAAMIPTSISSTMAHKRQGGVDWLSFKILAPTILLGSWLGVMTAISLSGSTLQTALGVGLVLLAINMFLKKTSADDASDYHPRHWLLALGGSVIGYVSSIFGIGGGVMTIPFLSRLGQSMRLCVGTSAACGIPIALMGAIANIYLGEKLTDLPQYSSGLVYWPAFAGIVIMSIPFARLGAKLAQKLPADKLKKLFAGLMLVVGVKFIFFS